MRIRKAQPGDLVGLIKLYQQLNPSDVALPSADVVAKTWSEMLATPLMHIYVLEEGGLIASSCVLTVIPNLSRGCSSYGVIENVVTSLEFRRRGFASKILRFALQEAWKSSCYKVMLLTGSRRQETLALYEKVGFQPGKKAGFVAYPASSTI